MITVNRINDPYLDDWFENPLDSMPIATDHTVPEPAWDRKDLPPELMEIPTSVRTPKIPRKKKVEAELSLHEKMYRFATKHNPFALGGSENLNSIGGSENVL